MIPTAGQQAMRVYQLTEGAVTLEFGTAISEALMNRVNSFNQLLSGNPLPGMYQTVPAYASLTVYFDPVTLIYSTLPGITCFEKARGYILELDRRSDPTEKSTASRLITIPVCYGGAFGPDLEFVAGRHQLTIGEVIRLHSKVEYKVYMIGFIPGFSYMGGLNPILETPRKQTPVRVPAGAVGIAGNQTGVYPLDTPGGWQIIGRTPLKMFDAGRDEPSLLKAGDRVRFETINLSEFEKLSRA